MRTCGEAIGPTTNQRMESHHQEHYQKRPATSDQRPATSDQRPATTNCDDKFRIGDWEIDTVLGKSHSDALDNTVDRKSKLTLSAG
ncbi:hypothetical protein ACCI51_15825 [Microbulbifer echini]|uniref:Uncharacterized protein n=1 Tax=Microbulbifer echini TaxID=1529067 RepID=A0ABV4NR19_9GAMM